MSVVIGTAGHIDHGKTALLRALTGIDADRLPEEKARGMTIDVGYAHLALPDGDVLDFVDVPGHDRLVGNMLVGAGEIDAAMLVVAADDGPRAQTLEHLALLDALAIDQGVVVITKIDLVEERDPRRSRVRDAVEVFLLGTSLAAAPIVEVSATTRQGLDRLADELVRLRDAVAPLVAGREGPARLAIDRVFTIRGHGTVVTGSLRGGMLARGDTVRIEPGGIRARIREIQARNRQVERAAGGRTALNLAGIEANQLHRGQVVVPAGDRTPSVSDRLLVSVRSPVPRGDLRLHVGTAEAEARAGRGARERAEMPSGEITTLLRLDRPVAVLGGDRFALRRAGGLAIGGRVLDPVPPRGVSRRRLTPDRLVALADATTAAGWMTARLELHGAIADSNGRTRLALDVERAIDAAVIDAVADHHVREPDSAGLALSDLRPLVARALRRIIAVDARSVGQVIDDRIASLVSTGRLARDGDRLRDPTRPAGLPPDVLAAMDRLEAALASNAPPALSEAARTAGCSVEGVRALEQAGRIVKLEPDLAYAAATHAALESLAVTMASDAPLTPAAFRDATGTSRRYVMALLEDFDRRGVLVRTDAGHVPGPRASVA